MNATALIKRVPKLASTIKATSCISPTIPITLAKPIRQQYRMSSSAATKEWLAHIPDFPNSLQKRLAVRPTHLSEMKPRVDEGKVVFGGATLTEQPKEGETPGMTGSVMLYKADTEEEVRERIRNDPYAKGGVWDVEAVKIWPFKCAIRTAL